ncbi:hypothetical protein Spb1_26400 [Planctopirus ephydatiae]|uniref:Sulfatase n=1 Tax=Planctopirus ephydatiae TaxID=2528019 RepID=A0A518GQ32_9PLAN|nr:DUF1501 domain-containing protein [Planctopirus ephydatiae]QDV30706.1 hypothetical protein Spb1_26400 [Planctopirus ephydatiae]
MSDLSQDNSKISKQAADVLNRRYFLQQAPLALGGTALGALLAQDGFTAEPAPAPRLAKAKSVIFLFMAGGPSQLELFEDKPELKRFHGEAPPTSFTEGRRFAFLKPDAKLLGSTRQFSRYGECGMELSELLPYHRSIVDDVCWLKAVSTDVFNHGPAKLFMNTGFQAPGRPSFGSWLTYGLGSESQNLPAFVVLQSGPRGPRAGNALWSSGFLPSQYQGVPLRGQGPPILHLQTPSGFDDEGQSRLISTLRQLNDVQLQQSGDPEIATRIAAYETAYRMQTSAPELVELSQETEATLNLYGAEPGKASFANNCLLARRLVERGVRFIQLYHTDWDHHGGKGADLTDALEKECRAVDQASAALILDLKQRGLLDDTLVIWGGEFGRTPLGEVRGTIGRDHHIDAFTMWVAGGGFRPGYIHGSTDELGFAATSGRVHVHDLHATLLHQLGIDHERLTYRFQGRDFRLTDVHGHVVQEVLI